MQAHPLQGAEMLLKLGEGASPTESMGLCLALPHPLPKTLQDFEASRISGGKMSLFYEHILKNRLDIRSCSLPAIFNFQELSFSRRLVGWPGQISLFTVIPIYAPEAGSNCMGLEQPHRPKRRGFSCMLEFSCPSYSTLPWLLSHTGNSRARQVSRFQSNNWAVAAGISLQKTSWGLLETFIQGQDMALSSWLSSLIMGE